MTAVAHYCTYFDQRYLPRALALYASLRRHCVPFRLWVLCLDDKTYSMLGSLALADVIALRLDELEAYDAALLAVKRARSTIEYYYTCTPALTLWLLETRPEMEVLTYLDADLYFFSSPDFLFDEFTDFSTLIV